MIAGKYRLQRPAGFGGMGAVWVARNEATNADVAVKVLLADGEGVDSEASMRFRREAHAAAQLYHRGIVRIFDLVELTEPYEGTLVMVMELLRGETLAHLMDKRRTFALEEALGIILPLLSALAHAHHAGIVHRDLKPENVFLAVDPDGHIIPKILDFGISKLTQPQAPKITTDGAMLGTPNYMSPEQARGSATVDARSDVFAVGILLYEMLAGQSPFASGSYHSVIAAILERDPPPLTTVSPEIWRVIRRALDKVQEIRFADASELAAALKKAASVAGTFSPEASGSYPASTASLPDQSVPPAPFRDPQLTIPSIYVARKRRARIRAVVAVVAVAGVITAVGVARRARQTRGELVPNVTANAVAAPLPVEPPRTPPQSVAQAPVEPAPTATHVAALTPPSAPAVTSVPTAHVPTTHATPHRAPAAALPAPAPTPTAAASASAPPPAPKPTGVVRDPGF